MKTSLLKISSILLFALFFMFSCKNKEVTQSNESISDLNSDSSNVDSSENEDQLPVSGLGANFSPDESKIAFYSYIEEGKGVIFTMNSDGTNKKVVSSSAPEGFHTEPVWSPDGSKIAFSNFVQGEGAKLMQVNSDGNNVKVLASVSENGYHMFGAWDPSGDGYFFFHWPEGGFAPNVYHCSKEEQITQITTDNISCRPEIDANGSLYINKIVDVEKNIYDKYKVKRTSDQGFSIRKIESLEGVIIGENAIKTVENDSTTTIVLESLDGEDLREIANVTYKGIMFPRYDKKMERLIYNTGFPDGSEIHMLHLATGKVTKLVADQ
ncbi:MULTISPECIES: TolB family protein [Flavobacteriaceae]|uniref:TolB family protein n=1 Tax=Flavobacteriaceae TaxID=49546 RepID=UPI0014910B11|nr:MULTISPECIES: PD40 domain-containing protein [Allomuricauda]MDC6366684.1 PD40 domain-containing protein [Muricauda sp. AC10]